MDPNFLLMALAGLSRDPNAGMNAVKGFAVTREMADRQQQIEDAKKANMAANNIGAGFMSVIGQAHSQEAALKELQDRAGQISQMPSSSLPGTTEPEQGMINPADTSVPNPDRQAQEEKLSMDAVKFAKARVNPFDAIPELIKSNPDAPPAVVMHYVGKAYDMYEMDKKTKEALNMLVAKNALDVSGQKEVAKYKNELDKPDKNMTQEQLIRKELKDTLQREPTAGEIIKRQQELKLLTPDQFDQQMKIAGSKATATEKGKLEGQKGLLDEATKEQAYQYLKTSGELPPEINRIFRVPGAQLELTNYVSKRQQEDGLTGIDRALNRSTYKADTASLSSITKGMDAVNAFEKGATSSLDLLGRIADKYQRGQLPGVNKFSQVFSYHAGDPDIKPFQNALQTAMTEYMKVINAGSNLTAAELSVMGQQRAKELLSTADNPENLQKSLDIMRQEMKISGDKFKTQRQEIEGRIKGQKAGSISQYEPTIEKTASMFKVDPELIKSMVMAESKGDTNALSPKGARGLMQLMPATIKTLGVVNPNDPTENILKGTQYFASLLKRFGSPTLALAAYNWGPENVAKNPDLSKAPQETVDYIKNVTGVDIRAGKGDNLTPGSGKSISKQFYSPSTGKTKIVYSDGTEVIK